MKGILRISLIGKNRGIVAEKGRGVTQVNKEGYCNSLVGKTGVL